MAASPEPNRLSPAAESQDGKAAMTMQIRKLSAVPPPEGAWNLSSGRLQQPQQPLRECRQRQDIAKRREEQQQAGLQIADQRDHRLAEVALFSH